jgi:type II secretory pathway component PulK
MMRNAQRDTQEFTNPNLLVACTRHRVPQTQSDRRGVVLIVVLVLVAMLALAGFGFLADMTTEYEAAKINGDLLQAQQTMASAETFLLAIAEQQATSMIESETLSENSTLFQSRVVSQVDLFRGAGDDVSVIGGNNESWRFSVVHSLPNNAADPTANVDGDLLEELYDGAPQQRLTFGLQNESAKLHLARVLAWDMENPGDGHRGLMQIPGMTDEAADSILDWIDADDQPRQFGAESDYYQRLAEPYRPRNALPDSLEELLFVKGVGRDSFYGTSGLSSQSDTQDSTAWSSYLTIHSAERNFDGSGRPRLALNEDAHTSLDDFESQLGRFLSPEVARFIRLARMYGTTDTAAPGVGPLEAGVATNNTTLSLHQISSLADLVGSSVQLPSSASGSAIGLLAKSPLKLDSAESLQQFRLLEEQTTTALSNVLTGRININSASEQVLSALIGDPAIASRIVQQRMTLDTTERSSTVWLLTRQILDLSTFRRIYSHITTRGDVHSAEIIVYRRIGGPFLRRKVTIDAANDPPRRVDWVDLAELGLSVSLGELEQKSEGFE